MGLQCPWAEHHITVSSSGNISTCCLAVPVIDARTGQPYNIKTHTISESYNSDEFNSIRQNLRNSVKDKNCDHCWQQETAGERSLRLESIDEYQEVYQSGKTTGLITVQLDLSNQCNLKCRTCNPIDSSMWIKEHYDLYEQNNELSLVDFQKKFNFTLHKEREFFEDFKNNVVPTLAVVKFQGGEPFLMKRQWDIVDSIIESECAKDILIGYHTNATIWNTDIQDKLSKFKEVNLCLSIDDVGSRFEYLRHPAKWDQVEHNLQTMLDWCSKNKDSRDIMINCVISPYNILTIHTLMDYFVSRDIPVKLHPTNFPEHFSISNIPENIKYIFVEKLKSKTYSKDYQEEIENIISVLTRTGSQESWKMFIKTTKTHDIYRKEEFEKTFPELIEALKKNGK